MFFLLPRSVRPGRFRPGDLFYLAGRSVSDIHHTSVTGGRKSKDDNNYKELLQRISEITISHNPNNAERARFMQKSADKKGEMREITANMNAVYQTVSTGSIDAVWRIVI